jgi:hypothetical protein
MNGVLQHHQETNLELLKFLSPLAKALQKTIFTRWPKVWEMLRKKNPSWPGLGGSIFQTIAVNYRTSTTLHRDEGDFQMAWIYYFNDFSGGELEIPELRIKIPVQPCTLCGLHGRMLYHGVAPHTGHRSSISFYSHYIHGNDNAVKNFSELVLWMQTNLDWALDPILLISK